MTPPFVDAEMPEVCARVALQLVKRQWRRSGVEKPTPAVCIRRAIDDIPRGGFPIVQTALIGMQYAVISQKLDTKAWLARCVAGSRLGYGFRRCFYDDYKATRRR